MFQNNKVTIYIEAKRNSKLAFRTETTETMKHYWILKLQNPPKLFHQCFTPDV